jgi:predicted amidohydrolase YtcJ
MQPAFDAAWGKPGELYEQRLGPSRAQAMNRWGTLERSGVPLAFGTDSPVTRSQAGPAYGLPCGIRSRANG